MLFRFGSLLLLALLVLGGCASSGKMPIPAEAAPQVREPESLMRVVTELRLHLGRDTYRFPRPQSADGRDLFSALLWKLDRLQLERAAEPDIWQNADFVIEFARARALEKLRRYRDAADAYARVRAPGTLLADAAQRGYGTTMRMAEQAAPPAELSMQLIDARVQAWKQLAWEFRGTLYEPLAREEAEAWEMLRVDWIAKQGRPEDAISAGRSLVEHHRESKLYGRHLIRLGDLFSDSLHSAQLAQRAGLKPLASAESEALLDQAFAAYELASEQRAAPIRREARARIDALMAYHRGVVGREP